MERHEEMEGQPENPLRRSFTFLSRTKSYNGFFLDLNEKWGRICLMGLLRSICLGICAKSIWMFGSRFAFVSSVLCIETRQLLRHVFQSQSVHHMIPFIIIT